MAVITDTVSTIIGREKNTIETNIFVFSIGLVIIYVWTKLDLYFENIAPAWARRILLRLYVQLSLFLYVHWVLIEPWAKTTRQDLPLTCPFDVRNGPFAERSTEAIKLIVRNGYHWLRGFVATTAMWSLLQDDNVRARNQRLAVIAAVVAVVVFVKACTSERFQAWFKFGYDIVCYGLEAWAALRQELLAFGW